jgi:hypothetical protein
MGFRGLRLITVGNCGRPQGLQEAMRSHMELLGVAGEHMGLLEAIWGCREPRGPGFHDVCRLYCYSC